LSGHRPLAVAIVGAGPAGAFTAAELWRHGSECSIDLIDRLPTPWGLLRGGVAPDHGEIKSLERHFESETFARGARFFGNVEVGRDICHADLAARYDAIVYAIGAQADRRLGLPGEDLPGSVAARSFVGWYNGHPDFAELGPDLSHQTAVVIGNGNVAADVARILVRDVDELASTEISDLALSALRLSQIRRVILLGRRGPAQAAFTSSELRQLGGLLGVTPIVEPRDLELDIASEQWLAESGTFTAHSNMELLREYASRATTAGDGKRIEFRFFGSPVGLHGSDRVEAIEVRRNRLVRRADGRIGSVAVEGETELIPCGLVLRSVGYRPTSVPGVPFDEVEAVIPNERGRVIDHGRPMLGTYVVGWSKRGSIGILGTNKRDARETVTCLIEDHRGGRLLSPTRRDDDITALLSGTRVVTGSGWRTIDRAERSLGAASERPRVKLSTLDDLLAAAAV